jgi:CTP:molybdopterin cytidylyltransferase MocA
LTGDSDAGTLTEKHRAQTAFVEWNDAASFVDIDVREDYEKLRRSFRPSLY